MGQMPYASGVVKRSERPENPLDMLVQAHEASSPASCGSDNYHKGDSTRDDNSAVHEDTDQTQAIDMHTRSESARYRPATSRHRHAKRSWRASDPIPLEGLRQRYDTMTIEHGIRKSSLLETQAACRRCRVQSLLDSTSRLHERWAEVLANAPIDDESRVMTKKWREPDKWIEGWVYEDGLQVAKEMLAELELAWEAEPHTCD